MQLKKDKPNLTLLHNVVYFTGLPALPMIYFVILRSGWVIEALLFSALIFIGALAAILQIFYPKQEKLNLIKFRVKKSTFDWKIGCIIYVFAAVTAGVFVFIVWGYGNGAISQGLITIMPILAFDELYRFTLKLVALSESEKVEAITWRLYALFGWFTGIIIFILVGVESLSKLEEYWLIGSSIATIFVAGTVLFLWNHRSLLIEDQS